MIVVVAVVVIVVVVVVIVVVVVEVAMATAGSQVNEQMSLLMYDVHNNLAPDNIKNMFTKLSSVHSYRTRSVTNENYYVEQVRTENMK